MEHITYIGEVVEKLADHSLENIKSIDPLL